MDGDQKLQQLQAIIDQTPSDHPQLGEQLESLGDEYYQRYERTGRVNDLDTAIEYFQQSVDRTPPNCLQHAERLGAVGLAFFARYRVKGNMADLDTTIESLQGSIDRSKTPSDDLQCALLLAILGTAYHDKYNATNDIAHLDFAVRSFQGSVDRTPSNYSEFARRLQSLGIGHYERYHIKGNIADLDAATALFQASVDQTPSNDSEHLERIYRLGAAFRLKYDRTGDITMLNTAIKWYHSSIDRTPLDHPKRPARVNSLTAGYYQRYRKTSNKADLDIAIKWLQISISQTPLEHPDRVGQLASLGAAYGEKYRRSGRNTDLDMAIQWLQTSVDQTSQDHSERQRRFANLGAVYHDKFTMTDDLADLDVALRWSKASINPNSEDHAEQLRSVGVSYLSKYHRTGDIADLETAIGWLQKSVDQTSLTHPKRTQRLRSLAFASRDKFIQTDDLVCIESYIRLLKEATTVTTSTVLGRIEAAIDLLPFLTHTDRWDEAYDVACQATHLVPLLTPRPLRNTDKQYLLTSVAGLASDAAAIALYLGKNPFDALQLLELGRGVISGSLIEMRTDITALLDCHPKLGEEFTHLRDLLVSPEAFTDGDLPSYSFSDIPSNLRYDTQTRMEQLLSTIRNESGFEDFLLAPSKEKMQEAASFGAIIVVNVSRYRCDAILVEEHGIRSVHLSELSSEDVKYKMLRRDLAGSKTLCWLWDTIAEPVLEALTLTRTPSVGKWPHIWWIPTRLLSQFPLHAAGRHCIDLSESVLDRAMSSYSSSIKVILHHRANRQSVTAQPTPSQALLVAVPNAPGIRALPFAREEVATIREVCKAMKIVPIEPGRHKADVVSHLPACKVFHFAGHGSASATDPSRSYLVLDDWQSDPLTIENLFDMSVRDNLPFLAYLSACGTGQVKDEKLLDESIHLVSAFQLAGFRHVIGTLWEVEDKVCVDVAKTTYEGIKNGGMTDESVCLGLHNASRKLRDSWLSAKNSSCDSSQRARTRNMSSGEDVHGQLQRDIVPYGGLDETEEDRMLSSWAPYVHYGI